MNHRERTRWVECFFCKEPLKNQTEQAGRTAGVEELVQRKDEADK